MASKPETWFGKDDEWFEAHADGMWLGLLWFIIGAIGFLIGFGLLITVDRSLALTIAKGLAIAATLLLAYVLPKVFMMVWRETVDYLKRANPRTS